MVSFEQEIKPLFRQVDIEHMQGFGIDLSVYKDVFDNADDIYSQVSDGNMPPPPDSPWSPDKVQLFKDWMDGGYQP